MILVQIILLLIFAVSNSHSVYNNCIDVVAGEVTLHKKNNFLTTYSSNNNNLNHTVIFIRCRIDFTFQRTAANGGDAGVLSDPVMRGSGGCVLWDFVIVGSAAFRRMPAHIKQNNG